MKSILRNALWAILVISMPAIAFAGGGVSSPNVVATPVGAEPVMAPYYSKKIYKFDSAIMGKFLSGRQATLQQLTCPSADLLQHAWLTQRSNKWTTATYEDQDTKMYVSYDFINCNINGYKMDYDYTVKHAIVTDTAAIETARQFMQKSRFKDVLKNTVGEPVIIGRYNGGVMYPMEDGQEDGKMAVSPYANSNNYTNITVLFPYVINGKSVYANYGNKVGITIEVTDMWVQSFNGQYINYPVSNVTTKEQLSKTDIVKYIKKGGNNRYYGKKFSVQLGQPQDVYAVVSDWTSGKNTTYLSSAILLPTTLANDEYYAPWSKYEMIVTDYKFANPNMNPQTPMY